MKSGLAGLTRGIKPGITVSAVTEGTDAQAEVSVRLSEDGFVSTGRSFDPDTLCASAKAYLHALNKLEIRRQKRLVA